MTNACRCVQGRVKISSFYCVRTLSIVPKGTYMTNQSWRGYLEGILEHHRKKLLLVGVFLLFILLTRSHFTTWRKNILQ